MSIIIDILYKINDISYFRKSFLEIQLGLIVYCINEQALYFQDKGF